MVGWKARLVGAAATGLFFPASWFITAWIVDSFRRRNLLISVTLRWDSSITIDYNSQVPPEV